MKQRNLNTTPTPNGFSLVEVSLALLVVGVGMMGALALFPAGLDSGRVALQETRAGFFADNAFDSFRVLFQSSSDMSDPAAIEPVGFGAEAWEDPAGDLATRVTDTDWPGTGMRTNIYTGSVVADRYAPTWRGSIPAQGMPEHSLRYRFTVSEDPTLHQRIRRARLRVWPGEFGPTTDERAHTFYTEFYDWGM